MAQAGWGQSRLSGRVMHEVDHRPISNAVITVLNAGSGAVSDSLGRFSLSISRFPAVLEVSHLGYEKAYHEISEVPQELLEIRLQENSRELEAVVVSTGYQQIPRERVTGAFGIVDNELFNRRVSGDVLSRLEDVVPGLVFNRRFGSNNISIRGRNTISGDGQPLIVVDNFPFEGDLSSLNPNDIENVSVLRDAAASSIWGARAGNGVIVITTKKGAYQRGPTVTFNTNYTLLTKPDIYYQPQMSSSDYIDWEQNLFQNGYYNSFENSPSKVAFTPVVELLIQQRNGALSEDEAARKLAAFKNDDIRSDLERYLYRNGQYQQYSVGINGGRDRQKYAISLGYDQNLASAVGNRNQRITINSNHTYGFMKNRIELSTGIYYASQIQARNSPGTLTYTNIRAIGPLYPYARLVDEARNPVIVEKNHRLSYAKSALENGLQDWTYNPLEELELSEKTTRKTDLRLRSALSYKVFSGLRAEISYLFQNSDALLRDHYSRQTYYARDLINTFTQVNPDGTKRLAAPEGGILDRASHTLGGGTIRAQLNLNKGVGKGELDVIAGAERRDHHTETLNSRWYGYDDEYATSQPVDYSSGFASYVNPGVTIRIPANNEQTYLIDRYMSYYANGAYNYEKKYIISGSARLDQSNLFGVKANQKGVPLWSAGAAWIISAEDFMKSSPWTYLKVRLTYGSSGNVNKSLSAMTTASFSALDNLSQSPYATIQNPPNPSLQWEKVKMFNAGLDFGIRSGALSGSIEYYRKRGLNLFGQIPYAPSTGVSVFKGNTSATRGQGVDLTVSMKLVRRPVEWDISTLFSYVSDRITDFKVEYPSSYFLTSGESGGYVLEGKPQYALYSYEFAGLDQQNGNPLGYLEGKVSDEWSNIILGANPENLHYHGSARPVVFGAFRNSIRWKNLAFSINTSYRLGYYFRRNSVNYAALWLGLPVHGDYENRWKQPGDEQYTRIPSNPTAVNSSRNEFYMNSSALVEKGDHVRLQDVQLSYTLQGPHWGAFRTRKIEIYAYANNLGILWKATPSDLDPDYPLAVSPPQRSIAAGLKLTF